MRKQPFPIWFVRYPITPDDKKLSDIGGTAFLYDINGKGFHVERPKSQEQPWRSKKAHQVEDPGIGASGNPHKWLFL